MLVNTGISVAMANLEVPLNDLVTFSIDILPFSRLKYACSHGNSRLSREQKSLGFITRLKAGQPRAPSFSINYSPSLYNDLGKYALPLDRRNYNIISLWA